MSQGLFYSICAAFGLVVFSILYPIFTKNKANKGKWPESYSNTYKIWENYNNSGYLFTSWVCGNIFCLLPGLLYVATNKIQFALPFIALAALGVVGARPSSISKDITKVHCLAAQICAITSTVNVALHGYWKTALIVLGILFIWSRLFQKKYETLIMEFGAFLIAYLTIIFCYFGF